MFRALLIAYVLGGLTFIPLLFVVFVILLLYSSPPIDDAAGLGASVNAKPEASGESTASDHSSVPYTTSKPMQGWVIARRTFAESAAEGSYVNQMVRSFLDARSKDPKRTRPKDSFFAVLKGSVLFLYEDELMTDCWAAIELSSYDVSLHPDGGLDGELFARRNAIELRLKPSAEDEEEVKLPSLPKNIKLGDDSDASSEQQQVEQFLETISGSWPSEPPETAHAPAPADDALFDRTKPWFIFVKSNTRMEDWYLALVHHSLHPSGTPPLQPLVPIFTTDDMETLVSTLDSQPDPIPMRWLNALLGRLFFGVYKTASIEEYIISRTMRKLSKIKRPSFLNDIVVREASVGNVAPLFSKPMLKELTKEGEASVELGFHYKGEVRLTVQATASINLGSRFKSYTVKLVLAIVIKELQGNVLVRLKSPPSNRIWYGFTSMPKLELEVVPVVSDRQIKWSMVLKPIESMLRDVVQDSIVLPNMDDIPFFNTQGYRTRGGIFPDAVRKEQTPVVDTPDKHGPDTAGLRGALSEEELSDHFAPSSSPSKGDGVGRSEAFNSVPVISINGDGTKPPTERLSSWFTSKKFGTEGGVSRRHASAASPNEFGIDAAANNGASTSKPDLFAPVGAVPPTPPSLSKTRSPALPSRESSPNRLSSVEPEDNASDPSAPQYDFPPSSLPSSSSHTNGPTVSPTSRTVPRLRSPSIHKSSANSFDFRNSASWLQTHDDAEPSSSIPSVVEATPSTSKSGSTTQSTASALLASWKARDKQALSATARETMKKWGWGSRPRKSDPGTPPLPSGGSASTSTSTATPATGEANDSPRERVKSTPGSSKATYEEVRAQVEERRHNGHGLSTGANAAKNRSSSPVPTSSSSPLPSSSALPMDIPGEASRRGRSASSVTSAGGRRGSNASSLDVPGDSLPSSTSDSGVQPHAAKSSPALPKTAAAPSLLLPEPIRSRTTSSPLYAAQPSSAPTMIIPSIHASRRGEVMSLGSSPPPPPPLPSNTSTESLSVSSSYGHTKLSSIQTMYRLFNKNSALSSPGQNSLSQNEVTNNDGYASADDHTEVDAISETISPPETSRLPRPPLPPRPQSSTITPPETSRPRPPALPPRPQSSTITLTTSFPDTSHPPIAAGVDQVFPVSSSTSSLVSELKELSGQLVQQPDLIMESHLPESVIRVSVEEEHVPPTALAPSENENLDCKPTLIAGEAESIPGTGVDSETYTESEEHLPETETGVHDPDATAVPLPP